MGIPSFFPDPEKESLTLRELENVPFIFYRRWEKMLKMRFEAEGISPRIICCNDDAQTTLALAYMGMGVGLLPASGIPEFFSSSSGPKIAVKTLKEKTLYSQIALVCRKKALLPDSARRFWDMMEGFYSY